MPLDFILSNKRKDMLNVDSFLYSVHRENKSSVRWRCIYWKKSAKNCPGRISTTSMNKDTGIYIITEVKVYKLCIYLIT